MNELEKSDQKMVDHWTVHTEYLLNRISSSEIKRMVDEVMDSVSFVVNEEGNIEKDEMSVIERDKGEVKSRAVKKLEKSKTARQAIEDKITQLERQIALPGLDHDYEPKKEVLEEVLEEVSNNE